MVSILLSSVLLSEEVAESWFSIPLGLLLPERRLCGGGVSSFNPRGTTVFASDKSGVLGVAFDLLDMVSLKSLVSS